ncbi:hypothetical protein SAMD00019534_119590 [Acytostelium subglobosum LB1]|uniref:hypothetical protein n=1 Tax=Acytostelium subglobosum LB1 TaxID=1410327 RepID=UPI00064487BF|nr:hypothetical protein SAMD00019534_119590 [Acytostelium subglobosum LB1]GAM28783.1 hypothetical protein SAMD00019534_119590 [Acytostelium subglobosum LB1]|eukprot:XP_012748338.1 hypothetical protein SAMD00019534_119590 [Acytostelium subglobosum LB1]
MNRLSSLVVKQRHVTSSSTTATTQCILKSSLLPLTTRHRHGLKSNTSSRTTSSTTILLMSMNSGINGTNCDAATQLRHYSVFSFLSNIISPKDTFESITTALDNNKMSIDEANRKLETLLQSMSTRTIGGVESYEEYDARRSEIYPTYTTMQHLLYNTSSKVNIKTANIFLQYYVNIGHELYFVKTFNAFRRIKLTPDTVTLNIAYQAMQSFKSINKMSETMELDVLQYAFEQAHQNHTHEQFIQRFMSEAEYPYYLMPQVLVYNQLKDTPMHRELFESALAAVVASPHHGLLSTTVTICMEINRQDLALRWFIRLMLEHKSIVRHHRIIRLFELYCTKRLRVFGEIHSTGAIGNIATEFLTSHYWRAFLHGIMASPAKELPDLTICPMIKLANEESIERQRTMMKQIDPSAAAAATAAADAEDNDGLADGEEGDDEEGDDEVVGPDSSVGAKPFALTDPIDLRAPLVKGKRSLYKLYPTPESLSQDTPMMYYIMHFNQKILGDDSAPQYIRLLAANPGFFLAPLARTPERAIKKIQRHSDVTYYYPESHSIMFQLTIGLYNLGRNDLAEKVFRHLTNLWAASSGRQLTFCYDRLFTYMMSVPNEGHNHKSISNLMIEGVELYGERIGVAVRAFCAYNRNNIELATRIFEENEDKFISRQFVSVGTMIYGNKVLQGDSSVSFEQLEAYLIKHIPWLVNTKDFRFVYYDIFLALRSIDCLQPFMEQFMVSFKGGRPFNKHISLRLQHHLPIDQQLDMQHQSLLIQCNADTRQKMLDTYHLLGSPKMLTTNAFSLIKESKEVDMSKLIKRDQPGECDKTPLSEKSILYINNLLNYKGRIDDDSDDIIIPQQQSKQQQKRTL